MSTPRAIRRRSAAPGAGARHAPGAARGRAPTAGEAERPAKQRRALTNVGGEARLTGRPDLARTLARALDVPSAMDPERPGSGGAAPDRAPPGRDGEGAEAARTHVHGFHSYPARMHPLTARRLVEALAPPGGTVLDPFCGSGTVLVEARLAGRRAIGVDANPLAVRLARLKASGSDEATRARLVALAREIAAFADERRKARAGASRPYGRDDVALFQPHVLLELDGLRLGIDRLAEAEPPRVREALELVLSSILTKVGRRASDTSEQLLDRRIAAGYPARLFVRKAEELARRLAEVAAELAAAPPARVLEGDARVLEGVRASSIDLVVTSPPYPGTYDYLAHHAARLRWLRLPTRGFDRAEIGARRRLDALGHEAGIAEWRRELEAVLSAMQRALRPGGRVVLLLADSVIAGAPVRAIPLVADAARAAGLALEAAASQERPHFHAASAGAFARRPREEHAIALARRKRTEPARRGERDEAFRAIPLRGKKRELRG